MTPQTVWVVYKADNYDGVVMFFDGRHMQDCGIANTVDDLLDFITNHEGYTIMERYDNTPYQIVLLVKDEDGDPAKLILIEHAIWQPKPRA